MSESVDVEFAVLGGGFAGSLLATILAKSGRTVAVVERQRFPRFAIGESSTPVGNQLLAEICRRWSLTEIAPLARFGSWRREQATLMCGLKRGFSYFHHEAGTPFQADADHGRELLVIASRADETADTHWLRSDVDAFLLDQAAAAGAVVWTETQLGIRERTPRWSLAGAGPHGMPRRMTARFLIDATGPAGLLNDVVGLVDRRHDMSTRSRTIYGHFAHVDRWSDVLDEAGISTRDYPFRADDAALHHVFADGWMWQLRFVNDVASAGFVLCDDRADDVLRETPEAEFQRWLTQFPSIQRQFLRSERVAPSSGLVRTGRLQRWYEPAAGSDFALLPHAAGFIDPLHSTGTAHTLAGVMRLAESVESDGCRFNAADYAAKTSQEIEFIDELVGVCHACRRRFDLFPLATMLYFTAATASEREVSGHRGAYLQADWLDLRRAVRSAANRLHQAATDGDASRGDVRTLRDELARELRSFSALDLWDPAHRNMYADTWAPE